MEGCYRQKGPVSRPRKAEVRVADIECPWRKAKHQVFAYTVRAAAPGPSVCMFHCGPAVCMQTLLGMAVPVPTHVCNTLGMATKCPS